ncbi:MAG: MaoC family dehydratase [Myxococcaceae bacterium]
MTTKTQIDGIEGLKKLTGQALGTSDWRPMKFEDIVRFADATGDHQWIHVDKARAEKESPFKAPIAHGYFSLSLIGGLFFELVDPKGFKSVLNYGLNKVRFPAPLKAGAQYRLALKLAEVKELQGGAEATMHASIEIQGEVKPACAAELVFRFLA